jgi:hypothetical protein
MISRAIITTDTDRRGPFCADRDNDAGNIMSVRAQSMKSEVNEKDLSRVAAEVGLPDGVLELFDKSTPSVAIRIGARRDQ